MNASARRWSCCARGFGPFAEREVHTMLALKHLFSGIAPSELDGIDEVLLEAGIKTVPKVRCVVLVGNKISPGNPVTKEDGTVVYGIDDLEGGQAFGRKAPKYVKGLLAGNPVFEIDVKDTDRYGWPVAVVILPDGTNLNEFPPDIVKNHE